MAAKSADIRKTSHRSNNFTQNIVKNPKLPFAIALLVADSILVALIIAYVPYTKIDWDAYMSQVTGFLEGERDYSNLKGDTGPLVYPAGFLYIYSAIQYVTGGQVYPAQILFGFLYIMDLAIVLFVYLKTNVVPWWALSLLSLSKRVHSIFVLRLFNDCFATTLLHAALVSIIFQKWHLGLVIFSGAVSIKMNVLLYAPPLLLLMVKAMDIIGVISALAGAALVQIVIGLPFILSHPASYISNAFNLGRVFIHFWSVNFKFVPEDIFVSKAFALSLLVAHLSLLLVFAHYRWCKHEGGLFAVVHAKVIQLKLRVTQRNPSSTNKVLQTDHIVTTMFVGNFIGIICARSLHYQFYSWYFYCLPYLLWKTPFPTVLRLLLFAAVEFCWNVFPSNIYSSVVLLCVHVIILGGLWISSSEYPYVEKTTDKSTSKKKTR
ncbi:Dol-P-Man:Man(5)GlcNAc(2)-PP-Dol alpha-1,3-mannosyltransferase [Capsicum annuum]|uniref:dolichyl-P-Man:Man5GlcNAc2-PP-dolichol alpha-1,3-mannosyltransferase n=1 Tax=Capsicum annuum TaxID=4072 RepID=A0A1U8GCH1_CAPAN|nr:dol-P-Man:Man(5)GlcNAc(2)-PP-Dol alpha-1,3-mannosyltransferase isoform X1 [Capsicum annuum]KAF3675120.1 Dol-P-Man:Man(5)GlcNAc(2)-PP-Dol alpha-1,3-mannosyltransferase [Capsicum annuum]PHT86193.1 Dol-P-Man:Man(5)GlcNAc(2)-PP-Dol alpha-1,3-mannosyltransferase [Capsicum annuum]